MRLAWRSAVDGRRGHFGKRSVRCRVSKRSLSQPRSSCRAFDPTVSPGVGSTISTAELRGRLADPDLTIVDVRPLPAYNGWRPNGEARGGHIPGAVAFPSAWLASVDDAEVVRLLHSKDIVHQPRGRPLRRRRRRLGCREQAGRARPHGSPRLRGRLGRRGRPTRPCPSSVSRTTSGSSTPNGSGSCSTATARRPRRPGASCSSTSTSASPRSTRRITSPARCTSTRTSSRTRSTGTAARRRSSTPLCARSGSRTTRR